MSLRVFALLVRIAMMGLIFGFAVSAPLSSAATPSSVRRVALVIGNAAYKEAPLKNPGNDAEDVSRALRNLGFTVIFRKDINQLQMKGAIREFGQQSRGAETSLFYFAGHGIQVRGANYLVPLGANIEGEADAEDQSVGLDFVLRTMEESGAKFNVTILDACRNNPFMRSFRSQARGLAQTQAVSGMLIAYATGPGSVAQDGSGRNGTYTKHLLRNLNEGDSDILKTFQRVRSGVAAETGGKQIPWESISLVGEFQFRPSQLNAGASNSLASAGPSTRVQSPEEIEQEYWDGIKNSGGVSEFEDYLVQYPAGRFISLARQRLQALRPASSSNNFSRPAPASPSGTTATSAIGTAQETLTPLVALSGTLRKIKETGRIVIGHREASIPFSYLNERQQPVGYSIDICSKIVDAVATELRGAPFQVIYQAVTSSNRIPLLQNGTIDLECGSTTNSQDRQKLVAFGPTYFRVQVTAAVKHSSNIFKLSDLNEKTIATTSGTTAVPLLRSHESTKYIRVSEIYGRDHSESFQLMSDDRAVAFIMDDILLAGLIANSRNPNEFRILNESLRGEPYAPMLRKDDPQFKSLVDRALSSFYRTEEMQQIYRKWFMNPIPPRGLNLNFPLPPQLRVDLFNPNDRGV